MQAEPRPKRWLRRRRAWSRWMVMRVPVAASGWPIATAPPSTLVLARSSPNSFSTARYCGANASFTSTRSSCSSFMLAFWSALRAAGAGPMPMYLGSTPATAHATSRPRGFTPWVLECRRQEVCVWSGGAEPHPPPGAAHDMGGLAHGLRAAREHRVGLAQQDELRALRDRLEARAAQPVDRHGGHLDREARLETDVAGTVDRIRRGLERVAEDGVAHLGRRHGRALQCMLRRHRAKLDRREVLERAAERAEARADAGEEDDVFMGTLGFHGGSSA